MGHVITLKRRNKGEIVVCFNQRETEENTYLDSERASLWHDCIHT